MINSFVDNYSIENFNKVFQITIALINVLLCFMFMFFSFEFNLRKQLNKDMDLLMQVRHSEEKQYQMSKENIALLNQKCHDLKYQIRAIGENTLLSEEVINEISKVVDTYETYFKTGNLVLDQILSEKFVLCKKLGISLTCIADGEAIAFMAEVDTYSLFGNILDNAIEAIKDSNDKKTINLTIRKKDNFIYISEQNYVFNNLEFVNGLPLTTKKDKNYHGYGMQSIKMIVEKYKGVLSINVKDNIFSLNILFLENEIDHLRNN